MESILSNKDKLIIQKHIFPNMKKYTKNSYNKAVQKLYMNSGKVHVSQETIENFEKIYNFMKELLAKKQ